MRKKGSNAAESPPSQTPTTFNISRRSFLKGAGVGAAGLATARVLPPTAEAEEKNTTAPVSGPEPAHITLQVNGQMYTARLEPRVTLANVLRDTLDLTGTKLICDRGSCGGCTVLLDGEPVVSCMVLAIAAQGKEIRTVEGL